MSATRSTIGVAAAGILAGAASLAVPEYAGLVRGDASSDTVTAQLARHYPSSARVERDERADTAGGSAALASLDKAQRAMRDKRPASPAPSDLSPADLAHYRRHYALQTRAGNTSHPSDPASVPVTVLALLGGGLAAGAAGYTVARFRHHGPVGPATT